MLWRAIDAELWGTAEVILAERDVTVTRMTGTYGSLYEIECASLWQSLRLHAVLANMPEGASWVTMPGDDNPDEAGDGVLVIHHWRDSRDHVTTRDGSPITQVRQPTN